MKSMKCKCCNREMNYNFRYQCYECKCGLTYNALGQELSPVANWQEEYDNEEY